MKYKSLLLLFSDTSRYLLVICSPPSMLFETTLYRGFSDRVSHIMLGRASIRAVLSSSTTSRLPRIPGSALSAMMSLSSITSYTTLCSPHLIMPVCVRSFSTVPLRRVVCSYSMSVFAALYFFPGDWTKWNNTVRANFWYLNGIHPATTNRNTQPFRASVYMDNAGAGLTVTQNVRT